jgi:hypothetical protein
VSREWYESEVVGTKSGDDETKAGKDDLVAPEQLVGAAVRRVET